jgi:HSP20 family protein
LPQPIALWITSKESSMFLVPITRGSRDFARSFDRLFDETFGGAFGAAVPRSGAASRAPALDVAESERAFTAKLEVPGVKKEDVKVTVEGRRVSVSAQSERAEEKNEGDHIVYRERSISSYARSFTLPVEVDQSGASAKLENGVLTLELPKRGATSAAQIAIN